MKLHLPKALTAAVIAAGFALSMQATATDYTSTISTKINITCGTGDETSGTALTVPVAGDTITFNVSQGFLFEARNKTQAETTIAADLVINELTMNDGYSGAGTAANYYFTGKVSGSGNITRTAAQNTLVYNFSGDMSEYSGNISINGGASNSGWENVLNLGAISVGKEGAAGTITTLANGKLVTAGTTIWGTVSAVKAVVDTGTTTLKSDTNTFTTLTVNEGGTLALTGGTLNLKGTVTNNGAVNLADGMTIDVSGMTPSSTEDEVIGTGNGFSTSNRTYTLSTGNGFTLDAGATVAVKKGTETITDSYDGSNTVTEVVSTTNYYIKDGATFDWTNAAGATKVTIDSSVDLGNASHSVNYVINDGATATSSFGGAAGFFSGTALVNAGGTLSLTAGDALGWSNGSSTLRLIGEEGKTANMIIKERLTTSVLVDLQGNTSVTLADGAGSDAGFDLYGGVIKASGTNNTIAANVTARNDGNATFQVETDGEMTVTGRIYNRYGQHIINKTGAGKLIVDGDTSNFTGGLGIQGGTVEVSATGVTAGAVTVASGTTLTVTEEGAMTASSLTNNGGSVNIVGSLTTNTVTLNGGTITLGTEEAHDNDLSLTDLTVSKTSTINANLVMGTGTDTATITFAQGTSVTLGCTLDLGENTKIVLDATDIATLDANGNIDLFTGVDKLGTYLEDGGLVWIYSADDTTLATTHALAFRDDGQGGYTVYATPEPATATLSLLALAGLCARRRRK